MRKHGRTDSSDLEPAPTSKKARPTGKENQKPTDTGEHSGKDIRRDGEDTILPIPQCDAEPITRSSDETGSCTKSPAIEAPNNNDASSKSDTTRLEQDNHHVQQETQPDNNEKNDSVAARLLLAVEEARRSLYDAHVLAQYRRQIITTIKKAEATPAIYGGRQNAGDKFVAQRAELRAHRLRLVQEYFNEDTKPFLTQNTPDGMQFEDWVTLSQTERWLKPVSNAELTQLASLKSQVDFKGMKPWQG